MKDKKINTEITVSSQAQAVALVIMVLDRLTYSNPDRVMFAVAAYFGRQWASK